MTQSNDTQWQRLVTALGEAGQHLAAGPRAQTPIARAQIARYMLRVLRGMFLSAIETDDADYPVLVRLFDPQLPYGNSNPDCTYFHATISPRHTYRIHGTRGSARIVEVQTMDGHFLAGPNHRSMGTLPDLKADANGALEIILSVTPQPGNWVKLESTTTWLYLRQYFYDWNNETPADLIIERVGATYPPPVISTAELNRRVDNLIGWIPTWYRHLESRVEGYYQSPADSCTFVLSTAGMDGLHYGKGHFTLAEGQAAIMEFRPPECRYWSFQIMNNFWESQDYDVRQTSLNGFQAQLDPDGVLRAVISVTDPGVPNWLDPVGHSTGTICGRVLYPASPPVTILRVVELKNLRRELHAATPTTTPATRSETLHSRMLGARRRYRQ
jgi:Protein of unknown function (DUF1214)